MQKVLNWFFPDGDTVCYSAAISQAQLIESEWLRHVTDHKVCVQAGGNCGLFPSKLACYFDAVYTAEPDYENFLCMALNCPAPNVYAFRAGFGARPGRMGLHRTEGNAGGHYMEGQGTIPVITIDSLALDACDLIALDVEGAEFVALQGAERTICEHHPTLILEDKGHVRRFGQEASQMHSWLKEHGYTETGWAFRDRIWEHPSRLS